MTSLKDILELRKNTERYGDNLECDYEAIEKDVKEAVNDYLFILECWNCIISRAVFDDKKLCDICDKYKLYYNSVYHQDISHEELIKIIFGDFENDRNKKN